MLPLIRNRYRGTCPVCDLKVEAGVGWAVLDNAERGSKWLVYHEPHLPETLSPLLSHLAPAGYTDRIQETSPGWRAERDPEDAVRRQRELERVSSLWFPGDAKRV
jgi:hypothetical protein